MAKSVDGGSPVVLVTGASGNIGGAVAEELSALGIACRVSSRDVGALDRFRDLGHDPVLVDFEDPGSIGEAVDGVDTLFLLSGQHPEQAALQRNVVQAASDAGVGHVVKVSGGSFLTGETSGSWVGRAHWQTENEIAKLGMDHTFLRPNYFMQNLLALAEPVAAGVLPVPIPDGRQLAIIDARDIGAVAARILVDPAPHRGHAYDLTGPEAIDFAVVAERMTAVLGHPVRHVTPPIEETLAAMDEKGAPEFMTRHIGEATLILGADPLVPVVTDEVARITGRSPRSIDDFLRDHAYAFSG